MFTNKTVSVFRCRHANARADARSNHVGCPEIIGTICIPFIHL